MLYAPFAGAIYKKFVLNESLNQAEEKTIATAIGITNYNLPAINTQTGEIYDHDPNPQTHSRMF
jgi:hypothetical protein